LSRIILSLAFSLFCIGNIIARPVFQTDYALEKNASVQPDSAVVKKSNAREQKDIMDVLAQLRKKKAENVADKNKDTTRKVLYSVVPAVGYTLSTGLTGLITTNAAFYLSNPATTNISSVSSSFIYTQYKQITVPLLANIWTKNNSYDIVIDWRYFKYPQDTYGLGGGSSLEDADNIDYSHIRLHQSVLKSVGNSFYVGLGYFLDYRWHIKQAGSNDDVRNYGLTKNSVASGPLITLLYDNRKNSINPLEGTYANVQYRPNMTTLGSNSNWQSLVFDVRKYINFPSGSQNTLAFWNYTWLTLNGKPPYLDLPSTSWDPSNNTGRGYIQGRYRSLNMLYFESEYRFGITQNGLLGGVIFANAQSFSNWPTAKFTMVAPAAGLGIRIKVNKLSRTNIAIDYGFGVKGSRGLFVNLGEVF